MPAIKAKEKEAVKIKTSSIVLSWKKPHEFRVAWVYENSNGISELKLYHFKDIYLHPAKFEVKGDSYVLSIAHPKLDATGKKMVEILPYAPNPDEIETIVGSLSKFETL